MQWTVGVSHLRCSNSACPSGTHRLSPWGVCDCRDDRSTSTVRCEGTKGSTNEVSMRNPKGFEGFLPPLTLTYPMSALNSC